MRCPTRSAEKLVGDFRDVAPLIAGHDGSRKRPKPSRQSAGDFISSVENAGKGAVVDILCGQFVLPPSSQRLVQAFLPERLVVRAREDADETREIHDSRLARLVGLMREEAIEQGPGSELLIHHFSSALFALALRFASVADNAPRGLLGLARCPRLQPALTAMFAWPGRPWTLQDLAAQCHPSRATLIRQFHLAIGRSPVEVLAEIRMAAAAQALIDSSQSVAAIGESVGYSSEAAFQRAFKALMGDTPSHWRATHRAAVE